MGFCQPKVLVNPLWVIEAILNQRFEKVLYICFYRAKVFFYPRDTFSFTKAGCS